MELERHGSANQHDVKANHSLSSIPLAAYDIASWNLVSVSTSRGEREHGDARDLAKFDQISIITMLPALLSIYCQTHFEERVITLLKTIQVLLWLALDRENRHIEF